MSDPDEIPAHSTVTPRSSRGSSISPSTSSSSSSTPKAAVSECLGAWLNYLQVLNNLCASGYRLAQTLAALEQWGHQSDTSTIPSNPPQSGSSQSTHFARVPFTSAWDDLARATAVATSTVKSHIVSVLQDFITTAIPDQLLADTDQQRTRDHNQQIILENAQTMINIQHQFCAASYDAFSSLMCCFVCQAPVGFAHDPECAMLHQKPTLTAEQRSQTPSPHFGSMVPQKSDSFRGPCGDIRGVMFGSGSTQASSEQVYVGFDHTRGPSPHQEICGPSPVQGFLENIRGPLPNPGHLLGMKQPFYRGSRSPLNFPLFPLNGQRRWSEAAAGEVRAGDSTIDAETQMRRWSMPWEATKTDKNTVTWHQTRIMPVSKLAVPTSKASSDRSHSTTPDSMWQPSGSSQDGLAEAIQLLSCRPSRNYPLQAQQSLPTQQLQSIGPPFIEEPAVYEMWPSETNQDRLPSIKFPPTREEKDDI